MMSNDELNAQVAAVAAGSRAARRRRWWPVAGAGMLLVAVVGFAAFRPGNKTPPLIDVARVAAPEVQIPVAAIPAAPEEALVAEAEPGSEGEPQAGDTTVAAGQVMRLPPVYINVSVGPKKTGAGAEAAEPADTETETPPAGDNLNGH